jgi:hypothetical protein
MGRVAHIARDAHNISVQISHHAEKSLNRFPVGIVGIVGKTIVSPVKTAVFRCPHFCPRCPRFCRDEAFAVQDGAPTRIGKASPVAGIEAAAVPADPRRLPAASGVRVATGRRYRLNVAHASS